MNEFSTSTGCKLILNDDSSSRAEEDITNDVLSSTPYPEDRSPTGDIDDNLNPTLSVLSRMDGFTNCGFSTAAGNKLALNNESLSRAKNFMDDFMSSNTTLCREDRVTKNPEKVLPVLPKPNGFTNCGFSTAAGSKMSLNNASLSRAKNFMDDFMISSDTLCLEDQDLALPVLSKPNEFSNCGFSTAAGSKLALNDDSLSRAKQFIDDFMISSNTPCRVAQGSNNGDKLNRALSVERPSLVSPSFSNSTKSKTTKFSTPFNATKSSNLLDSSLSEFANNREISDRLGFKSKTPRFKYSPDASIASSVSSAEDSSNKSTECLLHDSSIVGKLSFDDSFSEEREEHRPKSSSSDKKEQTVAPASNLVSFIDVFVVRVYPLLYVDSTGGRNIVRNEKSECAEARKFEEACAKIMEEALYEAEAHFEKEATTVNGKLLKMPSTQQIKELDVAELYELLENSVDPVKLESCMSCSQKQSLANFVFRINDAKNADIKTEVEKIVKRKFGVVSRRKVSTMLKVCSIDVNKLSATPLNLIHIAFWRLPEDVSISIKEGKTLRVYNLLPANLNKTNDLSNTLHFSTSKESWFEVLNNQPTPFVSNPLARRVTSFHDVKSRACEFALNEVDIVAVVIDVAVGTNCDTVYLADGCFSLISLKVWDGLERWCWQDVITVGNAVALANLSFRKTTSKARVPQLHTTETSVITTHPKYDHLAEALNELKRKVEQIESSKFINEAKHVLKSILSFGRTPDTSYEAAQKLRYFDTSSSKSKSSVGVTPTSFCSTTNSSGNNSNKRSLKLDKFNTMLGDNPDKPDPSYQKYLTPKRLVTKEYKRPRKIET